MQTQLAVAAARSVASDLGLEAEDAVVLQNANRLAIRLLPCDVLARVAPAAHRAGATFEVEVVRRLAETDSPVAVLAPGVEPLAYVRDGFAVTFWSYYEPVPPRDIAPAEYADALARLHAGMRDIDLRAPHFTDRVAEALRLVGDTENSPALGNADRELLVNTLRNVGARIGQRGGPEQLLHGEPHLGNVLRTKQGLLFIDFETCCRGPIEFDIAHCSRMASASGGKPWYVDALTPEEVAAHYPDADLELVRTCWVLMLGMVAAWRWDRHDQFPDGRRMGEEFVGHMRAALERYGFDVSS